jgi:hypothetical protein
MIEGVPNTWEGRLVRYAAELSLIQVGATQPEISAIVEGDVSEILTWDDHRMWARQRLAQHRMETNDRD